jgi:Flp pilus assembly pilin Flp
MNRPQCGSRRAQLGIQMATVTTKLFRNTEATSRGYTRATVMRLAADERGAVMTEYVVVLGFVGIVSMPAFMYLGYVVAHSFSFMRGYVLFMYP